MENQEPIPEGFLRISKSFDDYYNDPTHPYAMVKVFIDGKELKTSFTVEFTQRTNDHDTFKIITPDDSFDSFEGYILEKSRHLFGKNVMIQFARFGKVTQTFEGIITNINNPKHDGGGYGDLHIIGAGTSILLESGKDCRSFENKSLDQIIKEVCENYPREARVEATLNQLNLDNRFPIHYTVQYKESDYEFIKRLAKLHGEFFYYTGDKLIFGNTAQDYIKIQENSDLAEETFYASLLSQDFKYLAYNPETGEVIEQESQKVKTEFKANHFGAMAIIASRKIFPKKPVMQFNNAKNEYELEKAVRLEREKRENLFFVKGKSRAPELKIGGRAELSDINGKAMETYRIIEIRHYHDGYDYYNEFIGIPDLFNASPFIDTEAFPLGEIQSARVMDNNDPKGMGRVRVQFPWQIATNQMTPWIHVVTPHAGANKGIYFPPEIGEEVLINYENNNAEKPFVMGAMYNGAEKSGYHTAGNDIKAIHTRSGTKIILNDAEGSIFIEDPSGNTYLMDGQGNIKVKAPKDISFEAGRDFNVTAGNNLNFEVTNSTFINTYQKMRINTPHLKQNITDYYHTEAGKALINSENYVNIQAEETNIAGKKQLFMHSDKVAKVNSLEQIQINAKNGNSLTNIPDPFLFLEMFLFANCIVQFRPQSSWKGEFGFDWFRIGDTGRAGDVSYDTIIGQYYDNDSNNATVLRNTDINTWTRFFRLDPQPTRFSEFNRLDQLKREYGIKHYTIEKDSSNKDIIKPYYIPILSLFPRQQDPNDPRKFIETGEAELKLHIQFGTIEKDGKKTKDKPDRLRFEMDGILMNDNHPFVKVNNPEIVKKNIDEKIDITITCINSFTENKYIKVWAIKLNDKQEEIEKRQAGALKIIAPSYQMQKDIVIVKIRTSNGIGAPSNYNQLSRNLRQALIIPNIVEKEEMPSGQMKEIILDLRVPSSNYGQVDFNAEYEVIAGNIKKNKGNKNISIDNLLNQQLKRIYGNVFDNHFKLFFIANTYKSVSIGDEGGSGSTAGYSNVLTDYGIMFGTHDAKTIGHETLHGLGLYHTFSDNIELQHAADSKYIYKALVTDNVMDYSENEIDKVTMEAHKPITRISTWYWQWKIINPNIK